MKREILCDNCAKAVKHLLVERQQVVRLDDGPQGQHKFVSGKLSGDMMCDHCNRPLEAGEHATAMTIHTGDYWQWERDYLR